MENTDNRPTVLIVDESPLFVKMLEDILKEDYSIIKAMDGEEALVVASEKQPDIILLDVVLIGISGFEVIKRLKDSPVTDDIPVIFVTGLDSEEHEEQGLRLGAMDYITKPYHRSVVRARVANTIEFARQKRELEKFSMTDALTGLYNRRGLEELANGEWSDAREAGYCVSILMMDIDDFKDYNDTYGHQLGDRLLKTIGDILTSYIGGNVGIAARFGGEEFIVVLPCTSTESAVSMANRIREDVEKTKIETEEGNITGVTISIGIHTAWPRSGDKMESAIEEADSKLYEAKGSGKNKVCY